MKNVAFSFNSESLRRFEQVQTEDLFDEGMHRVDTYTFYFGFPDEATDEECHEDINELLGRYGFQEGVDYEY